MIGCIFCDLTKAFDRVNHTYLLEKLKYYNVRGKALYFFKSYLDSGSQYVFINGISSDTLQLTQGVSQGSVLGPILFLVLVNDLEFNVCAGIFMYADDTTLTVRNKNK
jgi:hypothetical protein